MPNAADLACVPRESRSPSRRREALLSGAVTVTSALLAGLPAAEVLVLVAGCAWRATSARLALVASATGQGDLVVEAAVGAGAGALADGRRHPAEPVLDDVLARDAPVRLGRSDLPWVRGGRGLALSLGRAASGRPLVLLLRAGPGRDLLKDELDLMEFAGQVAAGLGNAHRQLLQQRDRAFHERDVLAGALLDELLLPLYGAGLALAGADGLICDQPIQARERVRCSLDALDQVIRRTRSVVYGALSPPDGSTTRTASLRAPWGGTP